jgi:DNA-binding NtrC family response regulator
MSSPATILLIEDDLGVQAALIEALTLEEQPLLLAATVAAAEAVLQRIGVDAIRLVIADIHLTAGLQACEGYHLYERWHQRHPQLPFLLISGSPVSRDLPAVQTGEVRCLAKPFALHELLQAMQEATHRSPGLFGQS